MAAATTTVAAATATMGAATAAAVKAADATAAHMRHAAPATVIELRMMALATIVSFPGMVNVEAGTISPSAPTICVRRVAIGRVIPAPAVTAAVIAAAGAGCDHSEQYDRSDHTTRAEIFSL